jgi:hypothetical protein
MMTMPNFLVIGAAKAGTTSLYHYLNEHPQVFMSPIKETNFFAFNGERLDGRSRRSRETFPVQTLEEYENLFARSAGARAVGEVSPLYLESPIAPAEIRRHVPTASLVVSLRDPVERAISGWMMHVRKRAAPKRVISQFDPNAHYVRVGYYYENLCRYYEYFPKTKIKIILFDDLRSDTIRTMRIIFSFIDVDESFEPDVRAAYNVGTFPRYQLLNVLLSNPALPRIAKAVGLQQLVQVGRRLERWNAEAPPVVGLELRQQLRRLYKEEILRLQDLIQRDLSRWLAEG